jgi:hypothetical protein
MAAVNAIAISIASKVLSVSSSSVRSELESVRNCWFWLLIACTAFVAIGVLLEVAEDWFPPGKPRLDMNLGIFRPSPSIRWRKALINLGWKLVMLGVIGEGIFELATSGADEMLQQFNNTLLAITTDEAGSAAKSAKTAREESTAAKSEADAAKSSAGEALTRAQAAERSLAKAEDDAGKAQTAASRAQGKVEAVAKRAEQIRSDVEAIAPRVLTLEQQRQIGGACLAFKGHNVSVFSYAGDGEGAALGGQIITAFTGRGINVVDTRASSMSLGGFDFGIHVRGPSGELSFMYCLKNALDFIGHLEVAPVNDPLPPRIGATVRGGGQSFIPGTVYVTITVGIKPVPLLSDATAQTGSTKPK